MIGELPSVVADSQVSLIRCRLSPAAYYAQRMIQYLSRRDSIRQRSLRYQQNRLRTMSTSSDTPASNSGGAMDSGDVDFEELE